MRPFDDLRRELDGATDVNPDQVVRSDLHRGRRTGGPEVIYAAKKSIDQILAGIETLITVNGRVVLSQIPDLDGLRSRLPDGTHA